MRCDKALELISEHCEGDLSGPLAVALQSHLDVCDSCRNRAAGVQALWAELGQAPEVDPPSDFVAAVWRRIDAAEASRKPARQPFAWSWRGVFTRPAVALAAAALVLIVMGGIRLSTGPNMIGGFLPWPWHRTEVLAGRSWIQATPAGRIAVLQLHSSDGNALPVRVAVIGETGNASAVIGKAPVQVSVPVMSSGPSAVRLDVSWNVGGHPAHREIDIPLQ